VSISIRLRYEARQQREIALHIMHIMCLKRCHATPQSTRSVKSAVIAAPDMVLLGTSHAQVIRQESLLSQLTKRLSYKVELPQIRPSNTNEAIMSTQSGNDSIGMPTDLSCPRMKNKAALWMWGISMPPRRVARQADGSLISPATLAPSPASFLQTVSGPFGVARD
jgi:hypothetical protein